MVFFKSPYWPYSRRLGQSLGTVGFLANNSVAHPDRLRTSTTLRARRLFWSTNNRLHSRTCRTRFDLARHPGAHSLLFALVLMLAVERGQPRLQPLWPLSGNARRSDDHSCRNRLIEE